MCAIAGFVVSNQLLPNDIEQLLQRRKVGFAVPTKLWQTALHHSSFKLSGKAAAVKATSTLQFWMLEVWHNFVHN